jgi:cellulose synthase/poly-beta-1,6-N-acetylglucosamine synthase-like glycosyltransferase
MGHYPDNPAAGEQPRGVLVPYDSGPDQPKPEVSVIIPCRGDVAELLIEQLSALAQQNLNVPWELLIVDNGVGPGIRKLLDVYAGHLPPTRIVDATARPGRAYAINQGVAAARSDRLVMLDSDDVVAPDYLREVMLALEEHEFVGTRLDSRVLNPGWLQARRRPLQEQQLDHLIGRRPTVIGAGMALRRSAFDQVSGFDDELLTLEDLDVSFRLHEAGIHPHFAPAAVVGYRYRSDLLAVFRQERSYARGEALLHRKHRGALAPRTGLQTARGWLDVVRAIPKARDQAGRAQLVTVLGASIGRIEGSLRYRIMHL